MKVSKLMTDDVITAAPESSLYDVAQLMKENDIGFLPIVYEGRLEGVVTDRDLVLRGYAEKKPESAPVKTVMTTDVITVEKDTTVDETARVMAKNQVRRICVTDHGKLMGVCAIGDLAVENNFDNEAQFALSKISHRHRAQL
ncbi:MAG: CBS domain-containing protein [Clostridia bacterium]|nr:CBS domain-containing protein [Clostridia bacterium]